MEIIQIILLAALFLTGIHIALSLCGADRDDQDDPS